MDNPYNLSKLDMHVLLLGMCALAKQMSLHGIKLQKGPKEHCPMKEKDAKKHEAEEEIWVFLCLQASKAEEI